MADNEKIGGVSIEVEGDFSQLEKDFQEAVSKAVAGGATLAEAIAQATPALKDMGDQTEKTSQQVKTLGDETKKTGFDFEKFAKDVGDFVRNPLQSAGDAVEEFIKVLGPVGTIATAAAAGLFEVGKAITNLVLAQGSATEGMQNFADRLNISFQQAQKFSDMATIAGVSIQSLERASMGLATALEATDEKSNKIRDALDTIGVAGKNSGEVLVQVLEKLAAIPDPTERIAKAHEILGRASIQLEPLLKDYTALSEAVNQLGGQIDNEMVGALLKADDASDKLSVAFNHLKQAFAAEFAPAVTATFDVLTKMLSGAPVETLEQQLMRVNEQLIQAQVHAKDATVAVAGFMGGGFTQIPTSDVEQKRLETQKDILENLIVEAKLIKDAKDSEDILARERQKNAEQEFERQKEAVRLYNERARAAWQAEKEIAEAAKAEQEETKSLTALLKQLHQSYADPVLDEYHLKHARLVQAFRDEKIDADTLENALIELDKQYKLGFIDLDKMNQEVDLMNLHFQKAAESATHLKEVARQLPGFEVPGGPPTDEAREARLPTTDLGQALKFFKIGDTGNTQAIEMLNKALGSTAASTKELESMWEKTQGALNQMARSDLPQVIDLYDKYIERLKDAGVATGYLMTLREKELQFTIREKAERGESADKEIIQLENLRRAHEEMINAATRWGKLYVTMLGDIDKAFAQVSSAIANNIVEGKDWGDVFSNVLKNIEKQILNDLVGTALKELERSLLRVTGIVKGSDEGGGAGSAAAGGLGSLVKGLGSKIFGKGGGTGTAPVGLPEFDSVTGEATGGFGNIGNIVKGGGGGGPGSFGSGLLGTIGSVAPIVGAVAAVGSGIAEGILLSHISSDTGHIEVNTRECKELLQSGVIPPLLTYLPELTHLVDIWGATQGEGFGNGILAALNIQTGYLADIRDVIKASQHGGAPVNIGGFSTSPTYAPGQTPEVPTPEELNTFSADARTISRGLANLAGPISKLAAASDNPPAFAGEATFDDFLKNMKLALTGKGGPREFQFAPGTDVSMHGLDFGGSVPTSEDALRLASALRFASGTQQISDPLAEARAKGMEEAVRTSMLAALQGQGTPTPGSQQELLQQYLSKGLTFAEYQNKVADIQVAELKAIHESATAGAQAAVDQRRALDPMVIATEASAATQRQIFAQQQQANAQIASLQQQFFSAVSSSNLAELVRQGGTVAAYGQIAAAGATSTLQMNALGAQGGTIQAAIGPGSAMPAFSESEIQNRMSAFTQSLQELQAQRETQTQQANAQLETWQNSERQAKELLFGGQSPATVEKYFRILMAQIQDKFLKGDISEEQMYSQISALQPGLLTAMQGTSNFKFGGIRQLGAAPLDYSAMLANYQTNLYNTMAGGPGPIAGGGGFMVTVNAVNPDARSIVRSLGTAINETGRSVR